ncbi:hypothetical protein BAUCODRAFT_381694 [Baudoinia panamericana UAMH 10762]|uniref:Catalase core domain-containing protein n=1 Tax=Baudoinia panamericana (strain UAMH 10762) TaxID=717646 RepID=M2LVY4_BAUPA|nr:uncharacterized protein BAUCODRAFT_381694 [Baudoinia panamericana UAMH 10762]EMC98822.1 hypothetical protein BAUCODRAFT_381694 [Baudoinia panamericana UAMH 10762]
MADSGITVSKDKAMQKLAEDTVDAIRSTFDVPLNYRPVHAKGQLVKGTFTPSKDASKISKAPIFSNPSTPLVMRYSTDTGFKDLPDNGENGSRGFAIRFMLSKNESGHPNFDIVTNNAYGFIVSTGEEFLEQFKAMKAGKMDEFLENRPHAKYFQANQAPAHSYSFATEQWHGIHAFKFINGEGKERFFRWRIVPWQGVMKHSKEDAQKQSKNYQFDDLEWRLTHNKPIKYRLLAQLAEEDDPTTDSTKVWPETNEFADMGEIVIDKLWSFDEGTPPGEELKKIFYNPYPHDIEGIDASDDPLIAVRDVVYQLSGGVRRGHNDLPAQQAVR